MRSDEINEPDIIMDRKGWVYLMDDSIFIPRCMDIDVPARSRCMECGKIGEYCLQFRSGVLKSWSDVTRKNVGKRTEKVDSIQ